MAFRLFDKDKYTEAFCEEVLEEVFLLSEKNQKKKTSKLKKEKVVNDKKEH